jgi:hypothetical protein
MLTRRLSTTGGSSVGVWSSITAAAAVRLLFSKALKIASPSSAESGRLRAAALPLTAVRRGEGVGVTGRSRYCPRGLRVGDALSKPRLPICWVWPRGLTQSDSSVVTLDGTCTDNRTIEAASCGWVRRLRGVDGTRKGVGLICYGTPRSMLEFTYLRLLPRGNLRLSVTHFSHLKR